MVKSNAAMALCLIALFGLVTFSWSSHSLFLFNGLASPLSIAVCGYLLLTLAATDEWVVGKTTLFIALLFIGWVLMADSQSGQLLPALAKDTHWLLLAFLVISFGAVIRKFEHAIFVFQLAAAVCILNLLLVMFTEANGYIHWLRPPIFGHIRHLGLTIGLFSIVLYLPNENSRLARQFFRIARIAGLSLVFWSGTRASMLGIAAGLFISGLLIWDKRFWAEVILDLGIAGLLSTLPPPALPGISDWYNTFGRSLQTTSLDQASSSRISLWSDTIHWLTDNGRLWLGAGGNGFARIQTIWEAKIYPPGHVQPHNVIVQIVSDWGIPGLVLISAFGISLIYSAAAKLFPARVRAISGGALVYLLITGMLDAALYHLEFLIYFSIIASALTAERIVPNEQVKIRVNKAVVAAALFVVIAIHFATTGYRIGLPWYFPTR